MVSIKLTSRGQVFTFDYIVGLVMFILVIVIAGKQLINVVPSNSYNQLYDENTYLSNALLQPGYPNDWTPSDVLVPGIASSNRLDKDKLDDFNSFTYDETKSFYHIRSDYFFYFRDDSGIINVSAACNHGYTIATAPISCEPDFDTLGHSNLVKSSRLIIYNSTIIEMVLFSWN